MQIDGMGIISSELHENPCHVNRNGRHWALGTHGPMGPWTGMAGMGGAVGMGGRAGERSDQAELNRLPCRAYLDSYGMYFAEFNDVNWILMILIRFA